MDRNERERKRERERGEIDNLFIILLYNSYYFYVLYCKIKVGMLEYCKMVWYNK